MSVHIVAKDKCFISSCKLRMVVDLSVDLDGAILYGHQK